MSVLFPASHWKILQPTADLDTLQQCACAYRMFTSGKYMMLAFGQLVLSSGHGHLRQMQLLMGQVPLASSVIMWFYW